MSHHWGGRIDYWWRIQTLKSEFQNSNLAFSFSAMWTLDMVLNLSKPQSLTKWRIIRVPVLWALWILNEILQIKHSVHTQCFLTTVLGIWVAVNQCQAAVVTVSSSSFSSAPYLASVSGLGWKYIYFKENKRFENIYRINVKVQDFLSSVNFRT